MPVAKSYLKLGNVVFSEGSSVGGHGDVIVEFSQTGLTHFCSVLAQIFLTKVKLTIQKYVRCQGRIDTKSTNK